MINLLAFNDNSMVYPIRCLLFIFKIFLLGMPFDPDLAGIIDKTRNLFLYPILKMLVQILFA